MRVSTKPKSLKNGRYEKVSLEFSFSSMIHGVMKRSVKKSPFIVRIPRGEPLHYVSVGRFPARCMYPQAIKRDPEFFYQNQSECFYILLSYSLSW